MRGKGEGSVYKDSRGFWTGVIELKPGPGGARRRKVVRRKKKADLLEEIGRLRIELDRRGDLQTSEPTLEAWLNHWLSDVVATGDKPKTASGYRSVVKNHIIPTLGYLRLDALDPDHVRLLATTMVKSGLSSTYALNAHNVLSAALEVAYREGKIGRNVAALVERPKKAKVTIEAFTLAEALIALEHVSHDPVMGARWATSLLTGARRGEVLGIERDRVGDYIDLSWQLQRLTATERQNMPGDFELRHLSGGLYLTRPKSDAGRRVIPMFEPLRTILDRHMAATTNEYGLLFTRADGQPIDPDQDTRAWRDVLADTGIDRDVPLHGVRHTTVDLLYFAEVPEDIIQEIIGHSVRQRAVTRGYKSPANLARLQTAMEAFGAMFITQTVGTTSTRPALDV